jgi:argininosuccinate lyase
MQEDKEAVFDSFDTVNSCLQVTATVLRNIAVNTERTFAAASSGYMNATELADYLVRKGMPFRNAHEIVGKIVMRAVEAGEEIARLPLADLQGFSELIDADVFATLSLDQTLKTKSQFGGTSSERVAPALMQARESLKE